MSVKVKRSRIFRSSSQGHFLDLTESPTIHWEKKISKPAFQNPSSRTPKPIVVKSDHQEASLKNLSVGSTVVKSENQEASLKNPSVGLTVVKSDNQASRKSLNIGQIVVKSENQASLKSLSIGAPVKDDDDGFERKLKGKVGGFFEACYNCKKKIEEKDDIFMYSYLRAFCSPKCRDKQIALDKFFSGKSNATGSRLKQQKMRGLTVSETGKAAVPIFHI